MTNLSFSEFFHLVLHFYVYFLNIYILAKFSLISQNLIIFLIPSMKMWIIKLSNYKHTIFGEFAFFFFFWAVISFDGLSAATYLLPKHLPGPNFFFFIEYFFWKYFKENLNIISEISMLNKMCFHPVIL